MRPGNGYVVAWTTGYSDGRSVYMYDHGDSWGATEDRSEATVYPTEREAIDAWRSKHSNPDHPIYVESIMAGRTRFEQVGQPEMSMGAMESAL